MSKLLAYSEKAADLRNKVVVVHDGCFTFCHKSHGGLLAKGAKLARRIAKEEGRGREIAVIAMLMSDEQILQYKGKQKQLQDENERAINLCRLEEVDYVLGHMKELNIPGCIPEATANKWRNKYIQFDVPLSWNDEAQYRRWKEEFNICIFNVGSDYQNDEELRRQFYKWPEEDGILRFSSRTPGTSTSCMTKQVDKTFFLRNPEAVNPNTKPTIVCLLGLPGAGKSFLLSGLQGLEKIKIVSVGQCLRENREQKTDLGLQAAQYMDAGGLVPTELIMPMIVEEIQSNLDKKYIILDGFPRSWDQLEEYNKLVHDYPIDWLLLVEIDQMVATERILKRADEEDRTDDNEDTVAKRFATFERETLPVIKYFEREAVGSRVVIKKIDSNQDKLSASQEFLRAFIV